MPGRRIYNASRGRAAKVRFNELTAMNSSGTSTPQLSHEDMDIGTPFALRRDKIPDNTTGSPTSQTLSNSPPPTLYAKGIVLSRITRVSSRVVDGTISDDCLSMAGWSSADDINHLCSRLWRTLVADRTADGRYPPFWFRRACMYCLSKTTLDGDLNTSKLLADKALPETVVAYLRRVQAVVWNRRFFECRDAATEV